MNWYTPCAYQPDCRELYPLGRAAPGPSKTSVPSSVRRKYSPCSLKFVEVELPFGAHFKIPLSAQRRLVPLKLFVTSAVGSSNVRLLGLVRRCESPVCHARLSPMSPPKCVKRLSEPAPFLPLSLKLAGNARPRPSSVPTSQ